MPLSVFEEEAFKLSIHPAFRLSPGRALERQGWQKWLQTLGPKTFVKPFAFFHAEFWDWLWDARTRLLNGEVLPPAELVMLLIWFRGGGKSSHVEWGCIAEGARAPKGFIGYVCETEALSLGHIQSIRRRLDSPEIIKHYPGMASPKLDRHGRQVAWRQDYLYTKSGWGIIPIGLEEGVRGGKLEDVRFTTLVFDDIDSRTDSPAAREKKLKRIAFEILPAGTMNADTMVWFPQNLIDEDSCLNQIYTGRVDILSERQVSGPHPAFSVLEMMLDESAVGRKWFIANAVPTWPEVDMNAAKKFLADSGRVAFMAEYQHDFEAAREGRVLRNYNDVLMVIDEDDFARVYGSITALDSFNKYFGHDWSRTKSAYHANVGGKLAISSQNSALPGKLILFDLMSFEGGTQADDVGLRFLESISPTVPNRDMTWKQLIEAALSRKGMERFISDTTRLIEARRNVLADIIPSLVAPVLTARHYDRFVGSHDQNNDALQVYRRVFGLPFHPCNPGETGGLEWADHYMLVDRQTRHPFFDDEWLGNEWRLGCPGMFILVKNGKKNYPKSATPDLLHDSDLCRFQFSNWRMRPTRLTEAGALEHGPMKMNDDFGQMLQMILFGNRINAAALSYTEQVRSIIPSKYNPDRLKTEYSPELEISINYQMSQAKSRVPKSAVVTFDEFGDPVTDQQED
jgi:hypothetical protein